MAVKYEYNSVRIDVPLTDMTASQIGLTGVPIGGAEEYDRIKGLIPFVGKFSCKYENLSEEIETLSCNVITASDQDSSSISLTEIAEGINVAEPPTYAIGSITLVKDTTNGVTRAKYSRSAI